MWPKLTGTGAVDACLVAAADEAWRCGERRIGTDHLLLALLHDPQTAALLGASVGQGRAALVALDEEALGAIGLDVRGLELPEPPAGRRRPAMVRNQASAGLREVISRAVAHNGGRVRGLQPRHLLRSLLAEGPPEPSAVLFDRLGVDTAAVHELLQTAAA